MSANIQTIQHKTDAIGRVVVVLDDGCIQSWEDYTKSQGSSIKKNIFPRHDMSVVIPKRTSDAFRQQMNAHLYYTGPSNGNSHDSFNIRCHLEPGVIHLKKNKNPHNDQEYTNRFKTLDIRKWK